MLGEAAKKNNVVLYLPSLGDLVALDANAKGSFFRLALEQGSVKILTGTTSSELEYCRAANGALVDCFRPHGFASWIVTRCSEPSTRSRTGSRPTTR